MLSLVFTIKINLSGAKIKMVREAPKEADLLKDYKKGRTRTFSSKWQVGRLTYFVLIWLIGRGGGLVWRVVIYTGKYNLHVTRPDDESLQRLVSNVAWVYLTLTPTKTPRLPVFFAESQSFGVLTHYSTIFHSNNLHLLTTQP